MKNSEKINVPNMIKMKKKFHSAMKCSGASENLLAFILKSTWLCNHPVDNNFNVSTGHMQVVKIYKNLSSPDDSNDSKYFSCSSRCIKI
jgi:hypothetical protein